VKTFTIEEVKFFNNGFFKEKCICSCCGKIINPLLEEITFQYTNTKHLKPICSLCKREIIKFLIEGGHFK